MKQQTLAAFEQYGKPARRAKFLADMERILPWADLFEVIEPFYPKSSEAGGRPPIPLERMLRIYVLQLWFNLSDPPVEEAMYDSTWMRGFVGIDLGAEAAPDETTVNEYLRRHGMKIANGTIVDATIIGAPSSTKNKDGKRDPEMHQTAKGNSRI
jgi:IS5 family transposase